MKNKKIRDYASEKNVYLWQVAEKLNILDVNFSKKLRREFSDEEASRIMHIIDQIARENEEAI